MVSVLIVFIPLYPKLPLFGVSHTWVYIRLEDVLIAATVAIWFLLVLKRKIKLPQVVTLPVVLFWTVGLISTLYAVVFLFPSLANVFPNVAWLNYLRRIEYLILLPVAFSTIRKKEDIYKYITATAIAVLGAVLYGLGQKFVGFPAFLTMNEEFAKGVPLYLPAGARITSTFGGHYDLAAYLVITIALLGSLAIGAKNFLGKILLSLLCLGEVVVLLLTASRVSFTVYLLTVCFMLVLQKKKWLIIPVVIVSIFLLLQVSGTAERFAKTVRVTQVVYNTQTGQPISVLENLPPEISGIKPTPAVQEALPVGTGFIALPPVTAQAPVATSVAVVHIPVSTTLKISTMSSELSTISGSFLIQKALVYDISFTTRFQGEWPRAWNAFLRNPLTGTGYSSISLATDGDYLRMLGETGILGFLFFMFIFLAYFVLVRERLNAVEGNLSRSFVIGTTAAVFGVFLNAILIDVFEASKDAYILWILLGISAGLLELRGKVKIRLWEETKKIILSPVFIFVYLFLITFFAYAKIFNYYFVGDDFTWLRWAASARLADLPNYFISASGFFYRPLPKLLYFAAYSFFWLKPFGYHFISLIIYFCLSVLIFLFSRQFFKRDIWAFLVAALFIFLPLNAESAVWISSFSGMLMSLFVLASLLCFIWWKKYQKILLAFLSVLFFVFALLSHEAAVVLPVIFAWYDFYSSGYDLKKLAAKKFLYAVLLLVLLSYFIIRSRSGAIFLGGDYNYNLANLPFNFAGNLAGYVLAFLAGSRAVPIYDALRVFMRGEKLLAAGLMVLVLLLIAASRKLWQRAIKSQAFLFSGLAVISLLPYLGLGNLSERYGLLFSAFFCVLLVWMVVKIVGLALKQKILAGILSFTLIIILLCFYRNDLAKVSREWEKAGNISHKIVYSVKDNYRVFPKNTSLYFVNVPIRFERAWVFPVGLSDAMWFVYRDKTLRIYFISDTRNALSQAEKQPNSHVFVYENDALKEVILK